MEKYIHTYSQLGKVSIIGDLNSRCGLKSDVIDETSNFDRYIRVIDNHIDSNTSSNLPELLKTLFVIRLVNNYLIYVKVLIYAL